MRIFTLLALLMTACAVSQAQFPYAAANSSGSRPGGTQVGGYRVASRLGTVSQPAAPVKPFSTVTPAPTISPYLGLFREEIDDAAPNYYTFVRPQQEQQAAVLAQQAQLLQLQRQVQQATTGRVATGVAGGARFGDTGRYYSGWRR